MRSWKTSTKIIMVAGLILVLVIALFFAWWTQSRSRSQMKAETMQQLLQLEAIMSQPQREQIALLALKYSLQEEVLQKILNEYADKHDITKKVKTNITGDGATGAENTDFSVDLDFAGTVNALSMQHGVPTEKLAALLIDYRVMSAVDKGNAIESLLSAKAKQSIVKFSVKELLGSVKKLQE